jgi:hypothetical protein
MATFKGTTAAGQKLAEEQARARAAEDSFFLPASWWKKGTKLACAVLSTHKSQNGPYIVVRLVKPDKISVPSKDGRGSMQYDYAKIGNLAGITLARMAALEEAKIKYFLPGDKLFFECTGITPPEQEGHSPSPNFTIEVGREEAPAEKSEVPF